MSVNINVNERQGSNDSKHEHKHENAHLERTRSETEYEPVRGTLDSTQVHVPVTSNVVVEHVIKNPIVVEHHHQHTNTVIHPQVVREHDTVEIRQVIQPIHEKVQGEHKEVYAGEHIKVVEKTESDEAARNKLRANQAAVAREAAVTHSKDSSVTVAPTKHADVAGQHKIIEEITPVIDRDVEHQKTIHKDEKVIEKIHHAPEVHVKDKRVEGGEHHHKHHHKHHGHKHHHKH